MKRSTLVALAVAFLFLAGLDSVAHAEKRIGRYVSPNCTYYAALRRPDLLVFSADAWRWDNEARKHNFPVVNRPAVGAIVVFEPGFEGASSVGHVAYVERVNKDGTFAISEMNFGLTPAQQKSVNYSRTHVRPGRGISFILWKPVPKPKQPTPVPPKPPTPVPPTVISPTVVPASDDIQLLQACLEQGYVCLPVPFEINELVDWIQGIEYDPAWEGETGSTSEYLGFNLKPGTIINAPFDGTVLSSDWSGELLLVTLPNGAELVLSFSLNRFANSYSYELLVPDGSKISAGDPFIRYIGEIPWVGGPPSDCCELPGILEIRAGFLETEYGIPIYPLVIRSAQNSYRVDYMGMLGSERSTLVYGEGIFPYILDLLHESGIEVNPEPTSFWDIYERVNYMPKVSFGVFLEGEEGPQPGTVSGLFYMIVYDYPIEGVDTIVFRSAEGGGEWNFEGELKRFLVVEIES